MYRDHKTKCPKTIKSSGLQVSLYIVKLDNNVLKVQKYVCNIFPHILNTSLSVPDVRLPE
jgi:hypothetical protein